MRRTLAGVLITAGLLVGVGAVPAAAEPPADANKGCPYIGEAWSAWAQLGPDYDGEEPTQDSTGDWHKRVASSGETYYPVEDGPGVVSRVLYLYCHGDNY